MTDLGTQLYPTDITNGGVIVGQGETETGEWHAVLWNTGEMIDLGTLGGSQSFATAINNGGQVVGMSETENGDWRGFLWANGVMTDLGNLFPSAINERGEIVGSFETENGEWHAFLWRSGDLTDLGTFGGSQSDAYGINAGGQVVGRAETATRGEIRAFLWENGLMTDLGEVLPDHMYSEGNDINDRGQIVGWFDTGDESGYHPVIWQP
jgi:probable HAF family extracellular repeat protein